MVHPGFASVAVGCEPPALQPVAGSGMTGIGGKMKLAGQRTLGLSFVLENGDYARGTMTSLEIEDSDAPRLLSIGTQRQVGFVIDLNKKKASSDILGSNVKVVNRGGLMAIPLIPGYLGLHAEAASHDCEMAEPQYQNAYETQNVKMTEYDTVKKAEVVPSHRMDFDLFGCPLTWILNPSFHIASGRWTMVFVP